MEPKENENYKRYVDEIFRRIGSDKAEHGAFIFRGRDVSSNERLLYLVALNLIANGYLELYEGTIPNGFIRLTEDGADYLQGGPLAASKVNLSQYIDANSTKEQQYEILWQLIGPQDKAIFYVSGPLYFNIIKPYVNRTSISYSDYIADLNNTGYSTSRIKWFRELYYQIGEDSKPAFFTDLSYAISLCYKDIQVEQEYLAYLDNKSVEQIDSIKDKLPEISLDSTNKESMRQFAIDICNAFKHLIEEHRFYPLLYNDDKTPKDETSDQQLFYFLAKTYCDAHNVDINRESNPGIGEIDFKFSVGRKSKVVLEMKLSTNSRVYHGYKSQLPAYMRAEECEYGVYLIIELSKTREPKVQKVLDESRNSNNIDVILVDGTETPSASRI